jgi:hypothetical protein
VFFQGTLLGQGELIGAVLLEALERGTRIHASPFS